MNFSNRQKLAFTMERKEPPYDRIYLLSIDTNYFILLSNNAHGVRIR